MKRTILSSILFLTLFVLFPTCNINADEPAKAPIRVAIYDDKGVGKGSAILIYRTIEDDPAFDAKIVNGQDIRDGVLDSFDIVALPGGSGKGEAASMQPEGVEKVKEFVRSGHGYLGICAGAYFPIQQDFVNIERKSALWKRGKAVLDLELSELGLKVFGEQFKGMLPCHYCNGPVVNINVSPDRPPVEVLAWFRTETAKHDTPAGIQINSPAIVYTTYEKGPIITISPHPEGTDGLKSFIPSAFHYLAEHLQVENKETDK